MCLWGGEYKARGGVKEGEKEVKKGQYRGIKRKGGGKREVMGQVYGGKGKKFVHSC